MNKAGGSLAIVVFLGKELVDNAAWYTRWFKPGFVHCFVLVKVGQWVKLEGMYGRLSLSHIELDDDMHEHYMRYVDRGATIVKTDVRSDLLISPLVARTCVGLIKSVLGIRSWSITPWQLYKHLIRLQNERITI